MKEESARAVAVRALDRLEKNLPANRILERELERLKDEDRSLATSLFYGVLRRRITLDYVLEHLSGRRMERIDRPLRNILRTGLYQLRYLDKIPPWAAIDEAVKTAKPHGKGSGFVNAVLRQATRRDVPLPAPEGDFLLHLSVKYSQPLWLVERWLRRLGRTETEALLAMNTEIPPLVLRANRLRTTAAGLCRQLAEGGFTAIAGLHFPEALRLPSGVPARLPGYAQGLFSVQDESSQAVAGVLDPQPGERIMDLCAGAGGKTTALAERMGDEGEIVGLDLDGERLGLLQDNAGRLGLRSIARVRMDAREAGERYAAWADRLLLDAPCSGTGVIRRRPDIGWNKGPGDIRRLAERQRRLLAVAAGVVRAGGVLVYATCSTEAEEGEEVVADFLRGRSDYRPENIGPYLPPSLRGAAEGHSLRLWPQRHGTDGFFLARLRRTGGVEGDAGGEGAETTG